MRAHKVNEVQNFKRGQNPQEKLKIGPDRFSKPTDQKINDLFVMRVLPEPSNRVEIVRLDDGRTFTVGLFAMQEVMNALKILT